MAVEKDSPKEEKDEAEEKKAEKEEKPEAAAAAGKEEKSPGEEPAKEAAGETTQEKDAPRKRKPGKLAVVHVYSSKNDTIITATDVSGAETLTWASGGMMVKSSREEGKPYAAMQAAQKVVNDLKERGVDTVHIKIRAPGGNGSKTPGGGAQAVVRTIARMKVRVGRIEDVTPTPTDSMKRAGGRRGRRV